MLHIPKAKFKPFAFEIVTVAQLKVRLDPLSFFEKFEEYKRMFVAFKLFQDKNVLTSSYVVVTNLHLGSSNWLKLTVDSQQVISFLG